MRQIFLDIETTGFKYDSGHRVVEIAAIEYENRAPTGNIFHVYCNPEREMPNEAFKVHGISNKMLEDKPLFGEIADDLLKFVAGADEVLLHNGDNFDVPFLNAELKGNGKPLLTSTGIKKITDTLKIARATAGSKKNDLDSLCDKYRVDRSKRTSHGAVVDCELLAEVWYKMTASVDFDRPDASTRQEKIHRLTELPKLRVASLNEADSIAEKSYLESWSAAEPKTTIVSAQKPGAGSSMRM